MSALRIRYEIAQLKSRYDNRKLLPENASHLAGLTEEAYYDWSGRYPMDGWLASTGISLAHLYEDLSGDSARSGDESANVRQPPFPALFKTSGRGTQPRYCAQAGSVVGREDVRNAVSRAEPLGDFEKSRCAHAAADAHRYDDVLGFALLPLD